MNETNPLIIKCIGENIWDKHTILRITYILAQPISELTNHLCIWALNFYMELPHPLEIVNSVNDKVSTNSIIE